MSYTKRKLEELNVIDDFLMNSLAADAAVGEAFCKVLLSTLLQREIGKVQVTAQRVTPPMAPDLKGIRLDVRVEEWTGTKETDKAASMNIYDIEPHLTAGTDLPRHNRFYQALTDSSNLKSGERDYARLPDLYILMILEKAPFGYDQMVYSICNTCREVKELIYQDGLYFYYFYTKGRKGGNEAIKTMLRYIGDSRQENATDAATRQVHQFTESVKLHPEVRKEYMYWEDYLRCLKAELRDEIRAEIKDEVRDEVKEEARNAVRDEIREEVRAKELATASVIGKAEAVAELLEDYGELPDKLREKIFSEKDLSVLRRWHKTAAKAASIAEFENTIEYVP